MQTVWHRQAVGDVCLLGLLFSNILISFVGGCHFGGGNVHEGIWRLEFYIAWFRAYPAHA